MTEYPTWSYTADNDVSNMNSNISKQDNYIQTIQRCLSSTNTQHQPANFRACNFLDTTGIYTGDVAAAGGDFTPSVPVTRGSVTYSLTDTVYPKLV